MITSICVALSVDIDRYGDTVIERDYLAMFGAHANNAKDVRRLCALEREKGHTVFPPHDGHLKPTGGCAGHLIPETDEEWEAFPSAHPTHLVWMLENDGGALGFRNREDAHRDLARAAVLAAQVKRPTPARALQALLKHESAGVRLAAVEGCEGHPTWAIHAELVRVSTLDKNAGVKKAADEAANRMYRELSR